MGRTMDSAALFVPPVCWLSWAAAPALSRRLGCPLVIPCQGIRLPAARPLSPLVSFWCWFGTFAITHVPWDAAAPRALTNTTETSWCWAGMPAPRTALHSAGIPLVLPAAVPGQKVVVWGSPGVTDAALPMAQEADVPGSRTERKTPALPTSRG